MSEDSTTETNVALLPEDGDVTPIPFLVDKAVSAEDELEQLERQLFLKAAAYHGFDFYDFDRGWLQKKIVEAVEGEKVNSVTGLTEKILHDPGTCQRFVANLSRRRENLFSEPGFYQSFRTHVIPWLKTYASFRIWHVGCGTGEEVYSMAILLQEEGLYERALLYGTEMSDLVLADAQAGMFPTATLEDATANYLAAGGSKKISDYIFAQGSDGVILPELRKHIFFTQHNLVTDSSLNEFHVVICRGTLQRFTLPLQRHVHGLFFDSLVRLGILVIGGENLIERSPDRENFSTLDESNGIYRKKR